MFQDLVEKAKRQSRTAALEDERREHVKQLFKEVVKETLPEIKSLGFVEVKFFELGSSFTLRIRARRGYSEENFTFNMSLSSIGSNINYGCGANSARGKQMKFDYNWNDSKLIGTMNNALRALIGEALRSLEYNKAKGWT